LRTTLAVTLGFLLGLGLMLALGPVDQKVSTVTAAPGDVEVLPDVALLPEPPAEGIALVWTPGGLQEELAATVRAVGGVEAVAEVKAGLAYLVSTRAADGSPVDSLAGEWVIPIEVTVFDPMELAAFDPAAAELLAQGLVLLSESSAEVRRIGVGGQIVLEHGVTLTVGGIVDDVLFGASEMVVAVGTGAYIGVETPRYLLIRFVGGRGELEAAVRRAIPEETPLRIRGPGETPYLRHGDAVLPQAVVKSLFGEFAIRRTEGEIFEIDPEWQTANLVTADVPLLGQVTCHRAILPILGKVMADIEANHRSSLIDRSGFQGCFNPRFIAGGVALSHHAWGIAVDVNHTGNEQGLSATIDPRLVESFKGQGFGWGGDWLLPDPAHFEWIGG
jgi:hypothetical protein